MLPFDINSVVFHFDDFNYEDDHNHILFNNCNSAGYFFLNYKCGHRNVLSKSQVWMSIFHIINFKNKNSWTQGPGFFLIKN